MKIAMMISATIYCGFALSAVTLPRWLQGTFLISPYNQRIREKHNPSHFIVEEMEVWDNYCLEEGKVELTSKRISLSCNVQSLQEQNIDDERENILSEEIGYLSICIALLFPSGRIKNSS